MTRGEQVVGLLLAENQVAYYDEEVSNTSTALLGSVSPYDEDDLKSIRFQSKSRFYRLITQLLLAAVIGALVAAAVLTISREQLARVHTYRQLSSISRPWSKPTFPIVGVIFCMFLVSCCVKVRLRPGSLADCCLQMGENAM